MWDPGICTRWAFGLILWDISSINSFKVSIKLFPKQKMKCLLLCPSSQLMLVPEQQNNLFLTTISGGKDKKNPSCSLALCLRCHRASRCHSADQMGAASHRKDFKLHKTFLLSLVWNCIRLWLLERPHMGELFLHRRGLSSITIFKTSTREAYVLEHKASRVHVIFQRPLLLWITRLKAVLYTSSGLGKEKSEPVEVMLEPAAKVQLRS